VRLSKEVEEAELTPPDLASKSATDELRPRKIFPSNWLPTLNMPLVALPPLNRDETLSTAEPKPPSRISPARPLAPVGVDAMLVSPLKTVGTALFNVCRVEDSDSPTSELALRTTSGVK
jgi:hypothetical protein